MNILKTNLNKKLIPKAQWGRVLEPTFKPIIIKPTDVSFEGIQTTRNRLYNPEYIVYASNKTKHFPKDLIAVALGTWIEKSRGRLIPKAQLGTKFWNYIKLNAYDAFIKNSIFDSNRPKKKETKVFTPIETITPNLENAYNSSIESIPTYNNELTVDGYINHVLWTMENPTNEGFNPKTGKYGVYTDRDKDGNIHYNLGPGINKNSNLGKSLNYDSEYTKEELNSKLKPVLLQHINEIDKDLLSFTSKPDTISPGNKMILLDIAHNVCPRNNRNNMPLKWPALVTSMIKGNPDIKEMDSGSTRRRDMRGDLSNKKVITKNTVKNR